MNESIAIIAGFVLPPLVDYIRTKVAIKNSKAAYVLAFAISILFGGASVALDGEFDTSNLLMSTGLVFTVAQSVYNIYWEKSGLRKKITK